MRTDTNATRPSPRKTRALLWTIQGLLAAVFLFAGGMKLVTPAATLAQQAHLPGLFLKFIGVCEVAGALGLILPGLVGVGRGLTSLAAAGLVIIMTGATIITIAGGHATAVVPAVVGLLAAFVAYKRRQPARERNASFVAAGDAA